MAKVMTTDKLVEDCFRRSAIPEDQDTFSASDVRRILSSELESYILPIILRMHEEYYVRNELVSLVSGTTAYDIPYRAIGNKLRDVQYQDTNGNRQNMSRISLEDLPEYNDAVSYDDNYSFYVMSNQINLITNSRSSGSLAMDFFLRPNELVKDSRAGDISVIGKQAGDVTISSYANLLTTTADTITIAGTAFTAQAAAATLGTATFQAATDNATTATSLAAQINGHATVSLLVSASASSGVVTVTALLFATDLTLSYSDKDSAGSIGATIGTITTTLTVTNFPDHFSSQTTFDFVAARSPNKILKYDKDKTATDSTLKTVTFAYADLPDNIAVNDYVMSAEETIVPQLPTEMQSLLTQKAACRMLESLGDAQALQLSNKELERQEFAVASIIDNRVNGAPQKVRVRFSPLQGFVGGRGFFRGSN